MATITFGARKVIHIFAKDNESADEIMKMTDGILKLSRSYGYELTCKSRENIGIFEEGNTKALEEIKNRGLVAVSCGMGCRNTVSISSCLDESMLLCIQRKIRCENGKYIQPAEYTVKLKRASLPFNIMASYTLLLLKGINVDKI